APRRAAVHEPEIDPPRREVHVREGQPVEDGLDRLREQRGRDEEAGEELEDEVLRAQEAQYGFGPYRDEPDREVDRADEKRGEEAREREEEGRERRRRRRDAVDREEDERDREGEHHGAKRALAEGRGERHGLEVERLHEGHREAALLH